MRRSGSGTQICLQFQKWLESHNWPFYWKSGFKLIDSFSTKIYHFFKKEFPEFRSDNKQTISPEKSCPGCGGIPQLASLSS